MGAVEDDDDDDKYSDRSDENAKYSGRNNLGTKAKRRTPPRAKATPADLSEDRGQDDAIRTSVVEGLSKLLAPLDSLDPLGGTNAAGALAARIEHAMFDVLHESTAAVHTAGRSVECVTKCGTRYRSKYRALRYNLKDPKNNRLRAQLFSGELSPARLVTMTPAEMANDELGQTIRAVQRQSIEQARLLESDAMLFIRKTHKGEELFGISPAADGVLVAPVSPVSPVSPLAAAPLGSPPRPACLSEWRGEVVLADVCRFRATIRDLLGEWALHLPSNMYLAGKLHVDSAVGYLGRVLAASSSRQIVAVPMHSGNAEQVGRLAEYLDRQGRVGVVQTDPSRPVRDCYLVTAGAMSSMRSVFTEEMFGGGGPDGDSVLFAVLVMSKGKGQV